MLSSHRNQRLILLAVGVGIFIVGLASFAFFRATPPPKNIIVTIGDIQLSVTVAHTSSERERGLSGRAELPETEGMLFIMDSSDRHGFWMKDMHFPIDIFWIDHNQQIVDITNNAKPESYPAVFRPQKPALFVLETRAGFAEKHDVNIGARVTWPPVLY